MGDVLGNILVPPRAMNLRRFHPFAGRAIAVQRRVERPERQLRVADNRHRRVLARVVARGIDRDDRRVLCEGAPGAGGEILKPGAHGEDHVGLLSDRVGTVRAGDAQRADVERMRGQQVGPPGDGFHHRDRMRLGEGGKLGHGARILHPAAGDDHRPLGRFHQRRGIGDFRDVGADAPDAVHCLVKETLGIVPSPALHVLRQTDKGRAAIAGVEHRRDRARQRRDDLRRVGDAVPIAGDRLERIVHTQGRVVEVFHLLQDRFRQAGDKPVAAQQQHRQPVGVGERRRGQQVGGARPGAGGAEHEALAQPCLGIGGGGKTHALLVLAAIQRQLVTVAIQRLAKAGGIAVAEDPEAAAEQAVFFPVDHDELAREPAHDRLRRCQPYRFFCHVPPRLFRSVEGDWPDCRLRLFDSQVTVFATGCKMKWRRMGR